MLEGPLGTACCRCVCGAKPQGGSPRGARGLESNARVSRRRSSCENGRPVRRSPCTMEHGAGDAGVERVRKPCVARRTQGRARSSLVSYDKRRSGTVKRQAKKRNCQAPSAPAARFELRSKVAEPPRPLAGTCHVPTKMQTMGQLRNLLRRVAFRLGCSHSGFEARMSRSARGRPNHPS